jgi:hypothetical protein
MTNIPYSYKRLHGLRYVFTSAGRKKIEKAVDFVPLGIRNIFNLGFGDVLSDGSIDDTVNSNNGDIVMVLATVISILKDFTAEFPQAEIYFSGSTIERTRLYTRILKTYYTSFSKEFKITAIIASDNNNQQVQFDPDSRTEYLGFLVKRN